MQDDTAQPEPKPPATALPVAQSRELLNGEIFYSLRGAEVLIEAWRRHYNTARPHSALGYRPPAHEAILPKTDATLP